MLPLPKWLGRPETHPRRAIVDAILYGTRTGCAWRQLPIDFPPWPTVYWYFTQWNKYDRGGALTYLAAYDVHRATLYGRCAASTGIEPFMALVEQVMSQEPYKSA